MPECGTEIEISEVLSSQLKKIDAKRSRIKELKI